MSKETYPVKIGRLPFVINALNQSSNAPLPDFLDFYLDYEVEYDLLVQQVNEEVLDNLDKAYNIGSEITGNMMDDAFGSKYADDFIRFLIENENNIENKTILEIGCGNGYLLSRLHKLGAKVLGLEPGQHAQQHKNQYGFEIIQGFYPSPKIKEKFDIIIFYNVLEHITKFQDFLLNAVNQLNDNGRLYFAVPDCEKAIEQGDISMLIHEHVNYFTTSSLENIALKVLNHNLKVEKSLYGSELNCIVYKDSVYHKTINTNFLNTVEFIDRIEPFSVKFYRLVQSALLNNDKIAIYVPSRIINILSIKFEMDKLNNIFFIDDDPKLKGKYFPGFDVVIHDFNFLIYNQVDTILIMSYSFSEQIKNRIEKLLSYRVKIITTEELLGES